MVDPSGLGRDQTNHVIEGADQVKVSLVGQGARFEAEIVLKDSRTDLAVLRLKDSHEKIPDTRFRQLR